MRHSSNPVTKRGRFSIGVNLFSYRRLCKTSKPGKTGKFPLLRYYRPLRNTLRTATGKLNWRADGGVLFDAYPSHSRDTRSIITCAGRVVRPCRSKARFSSKVYRFDISYKVLQGFLKSADVAPVHQCLKRQLDSQRETKTRIVRRYFL